MLTDAIRVADVVSGDPNTAEHARRSANKLKNDIPPMVGAREASLAFAVQVGINGPALTMAPPAPPAEAGLAQNVTVANKLSTGLVVALDDGLVIGWYEGAFRPRTHARFVSYASIRSVHKCSLTGAENWGGMEIQADDRYLIGVVERTRFAGLWNHFARLLVEEAGLIGHYAISDQRLVLDDGDPHWECEPVVP